MRMIRFSLIALALFAACGDNADKNETPTDAAKPRVDGKPADAPIDAPQASVITLNGGANDLWWDATDKALYFTDSNANKLDKWTDANGIAELANLPVVTGPNPGGLLRIADGTFFTVNFSQTTQNQLEDISPTNVSTAYTGLTGTIKYLDIEQAPNDGTYYLAGFTGTSAAPVGRIYTLAIDTATHVVVQTEILGPETVGMEDLKKIVGMVVTNDAIYGSNQTQNQIEKWDRTTLAHTVFATGLDKGDFLYQLPGGDFLTGGAAKVNRIKADGMVSVIDTAGASLVTVHGISYDAVGKRLFVLDHTSSNLPDTVHIIPFEE